MTKENKKVEEKQDLMMSLKSNDTLQKILSSALKTTTGLENSVLPKIADAIRNLILEYKKATEKQTKTDQTIKAIQTKALREHAYSLVNYNRKEGVNSSFETLVTRAIQSAITSVDYPKEVQIDAKNSTIFVMSKIAVPFKVQQLKGVKGGTTKVPNTDENLVPVHTGIIDKVFRSKYAVASRRRAKTKDAKDELTFKELSKQFLKMFNKISVLAKTKNAEFVDHIDEKSMETLGNIKASFDAEYNNIRNTYDKYEIDIDGEKLEKKAS